MYCSNSSPTSIYGYHYPHLLENDSSPAQYIELPTPQQFEYETVILPSQCQACSKQLEEGGSGRKEPEFWSILDLDSQNIKYLPCDNFQKSQLLPLYSIRPMQQRIVEQELPGCFLTSYQTSNQNRSPIPLTERSSNVSLTTLTNTVGTSVGTQNGNQSFRCVPCGMVFNKSCYLTQHNQARHRENMKYKCPRCGKRFFINQAFEEHLAKHNEGNKSFKCDLCTKQYYHKTDLRRHMCTHTGIKLHTCGTCNKSFTRKDHMIKHSLLHFKKKKRRENVPLKQG